MLEKNISAIVLAAGRGKRMKGYYPKVLYSLLGKPLIYYVLKELTAIDCIKQIIIVIGYKRDLVKSEVSKLFKNYKNLEFVYQNKLLGTADAVRKAEYKVRYPNVLIMCADTPLITKNTLSSFIKTYFIDKKPCYLITANIEKDTDLGRVLRDDKGNISAICEKLEFNKGEASEFKEVNSGIYIFKKDVLFKNLKKIKLNKKKKEYFLTDIINILYNQDIEIGGYVLNNKEEILGVNTIRELYEAENILRDRIIENFINRGIRIVDPKTTFIEDGVKIGKETIIYPFTFIEKNVIIGAYCSIGPFIRLRQGTKVSDYTYLGNFLEICRSKIGKRVKIKHFGYLGDTYVKDNVNIGAGTVVANFDGKNKNKTFIDKDAFIGSDTILIAPVKVGKGAITGAGSVVTKDVKPKTVVVGVPARILKNK